MPPTMIVGARRPADEALRLREYSPGFEPQRFADSPSSSSSTTSAGGSSPVLESRCLPSAPRCSVCRRAENWRSQMGLRHPDVYGAVFCASPGGGYRPPAVMPSPVPRAYLVAGTLEPFFLANATRWAAALRRVGAHVVMTERVGSHGDAFWQAEFPLMVTWAFWTMNHAVLVGEQDAGLPGRSRGSSEGRASDHEAQRGGQPRRRALDLVIAATANIHRLPPLARNPKDFTLVADLVDARAPILDLNRIALHERPLKAHTGRQHPLQTTLFCSRVVTGMVTRL